MLCMTDQIEQHKRPVVLHMNCEGINARIEF